MSFLGQMRAYYILGFLTFLGLIAFSQTDTTKHKSHGLKLAHDSSSVFGTKGVIQNESDQPTLLIGGLVSAYYASYSDETKNGPYVQFPTMAPRDKQIGLNMALVDMRYSSHNVRGNLGIHWGDIPNDDWPAEFNMIQEANGGCRLFKGLWLDAGFFRSHIGLESIQPRENITSSMSLVDNFEPFFLAGAKLTYVFSPKFSLQVNTFNSFNTFVDHNKNKLIGGSIIYDPNSKLSFSYNFVTGDETADSIAFKHQRYYHNFYATIKLEKFILGFEANYGTQQHSLLTDSTKTARIVSGIIVGRYQCLKRLAIYARGEYFSDPDRVLTGSINFGKYIMGTTAGLEFKAYKNISLSVEGRILQADNYLFKEGNFHTNQRYEANCCLDISF